jgi:hypothetical protein
VSRNVTLAGYAVLAVAALAYELAARRWRRTPTLAEAVEWVTRWPAARALLLAGWLWVGWHVFVRSGSP